MSTAPDRIVALEASARAALPALHEVPAPGWVCRLSGGTTKRVNSVNPVAPDARLDPVLAVAEERYRAFALPVRFRLTPLAAADCDGALAEAGYRLIDPSFTMTAALAPCAIDPCVRVATRPDQAWCSGLAAASGWSAADDHAHRALVERVPAGSAVAVIDEGDGPLAFGAAGLGDGRVCLYDIVVAPAARGRGLGRRLVEGLLGWAYAQGHAEALLQVLATNLAARALYLSLGFVDAYPYHYRIAPD